ncbi:MAG: hypothetical protein Q4B60_06900 [Erysipelotrichaceae bacterium]|nr:hypothetical protein [Erysipelotrichaceae bacterium]
MNEAIIGGADKPTLVYINSFPLSSILLILLLIVFITIAIVIIKNHE